MRTKVALLSLRYNPAFVQYLLAFGKAMQELGYIPEFIVDSGYLNSPELESVGPVREAVSDVLATDWSHAVFLNPSVKNAQMAAALKQNRVKILYLFHEPWQMSLSYIKNEGLLPALKGAMAHRVTVPILKLADCVMLPSRYALTEYQKRDVRYNSNCVYLPLLYDDEINGRLEDQIPNKRYFGYIGSLGPSHGFNEFMQFLKFALQHDPNLQFLIASRGPFPERMAEDPVVKRNASRIEIRCGKPLGTDEMNRYYAESFCVWNLYRRSTQSGVLPKAFMFGSPVIADSIGSFPEFLQDRVNGRFANPKNVHEIWAAVEDIRTNLAQYAINCRRSFLDTFYYRSHLLDIAGFM